MGKRFFKEVIWNSDVDDSIMGKDRKFLVVLVNLDLESIEISTL